MSASISPVQYSYANVTDRPGEAYGYLIYVRSELFEAAVRALDLE